MRELFALVKRNVKLFFKDKGLFFTSLVTPMILLFLYATFLAKVYKDSFLSSFGAYDPSYELANAFVGGQLVSSLVAVCAVTVSFCSNMLMVQDKMSGARKDLFLTPVKPSTLALGYYISTVVTTFLVCLVAIAAGFIYLAFVGWYLSFLDIVGLLADTLLLVLFGSALSSIVNRFLSSQGQISAVGTIVSAGYGFICGAYMPISQFGKGLQNAVAFFPGTYGTSLTRNHALAGVFRKMAENELYPPALIDGVKDAVDCNLYFFGKCVPVGGMYAVLAGSAVLLIVAYVFIHVFATKKGK